MREKMRMRKIWKQGIVMILAMLLCISVTGSAGAEAGGYCVSGKDNFTHTEVTLTGDGASDIVKLALKQVGRNGSSLGYTYHWCANFVTDCAALVGQGNAVPFQSYYTCEVVNLRTKLQGIGLKNIGTGSVRAGDIVVYNNGSDWSHCGIITDSSGNTVEGNMGGTSYTKSTVKTASIWNRGYSITEVYRPNYSTPGVSLSLSATSKEIFTGDSFKITANIKPEGMACSWTSNNTAVATVSDGNMTGVSAGTAVITCTALGVSRSCTVTVKRRTGMLNIGGYLDGVSANNVTGYGTFDVYINDVLDEPGGVSFYSKEWEEGTRYEIRNITPLAYHSFGGYYKGVESGTLGLSTNTEVKLIFTSDGVATADWQIAKALPGNLDPTLLDIEYDNYYETVAASSPGDGWVKGALVSTEYVNSGSPYESDFEQPTSETRVLVSYYYYHFCAQSGNNANYEYTSKYVHYDSITNPALVTVASTDTDAIDNRYTIYNLKWASNGSWAYCKSGTTCDGSYGSHGTRSYHWYRRYIYQNKTPVYKYKWTKQTGWTDTWDRNAQDVTVRYRLKGGIAYTGMDITEIESEDALVMTAGESCQIVYTVTPRGSDLSEITFTSSSSAVTVDADGTIHAGYSSSTPAAIVTIEAPSGAKKEIAITTEHNIISESLLLNGNPAQEFPVVDVFALNQQVAYNYSCTLSNAYDPGYRPVFTTSPAGRVSQNATASFLTFSQAGVFELSNASPYRSAKYGTVVVVDPVLTFQLPAQTEVIEESAFSGIRARYFRLPAGVRSIGANAFPSGSTVFVNTAYLEEIAPDTGAALYVEEGPVYNMDFASRISDPDHYAVPRGTPLTVWGEWSEWSEIPAAEDENTQVMTKTQYRSSTVDYVTRYSEWSGWSNWSLTAESIPDATLKQGKTQTVYPYYCFVCPTCGWHSPYWGSGKCTQGHDIPSSSFQVNLYEITTPKSGCTMYNSIKYICVYNGQNWFYWDDGTSDRQNPKTMYSYRTRTSWRDPVYGEWSGWSDTPVEATDTLRVETRTLYSYQTRN